VKLKLFERSEVDGDTILRLIPDLPDWSSSAAK